MKIQHLHYAFFLLSSILLFDATVAQGTSPQYTDYLPKYRTISSGFIISKIDYTDQEMILNFRYVASKDNDIIQFYGNSKGNAWQLTTAIHPRYANQAVTHKVKIYNIRLNDDQQKSTLDANSETTVKAKKGDIITCELRVPKFPRTTRTVHLKGGAVNVQGTERFAANDILIKTVDNSTLGSSKQMEQSIQKFYSEQRHVNYPDIKAVTSTDEQKRFDKNLAEAKTTKRESPLKKSMEPIDYMPKTLSSADDLDCNERIILKNVYFQDDKADFSGRVKAMKTLGVVIEYLNYNKKAKIVLHGHTDIFGNSYKNLELSKQRVLTVKLAMAKKGIERNRIITAYHGGTQPLTRYKNGGAMNRRVEVEVLCAGVIGEIEAPDLKSTTSND